MFQRSFLECCLMKASHRVASFFQLNLRACRFANSEFDTFEVGILLITSQAQHALCRGCGSLKAVMQLDGLAGLESQACGWMLFLDLWCYILRPAGVEARQISKADRSAISRLNCGLEEAPKQRYIAADICRCLCMLYSLVDLQDWIVAACL